MNIGIAIFVKTPGLSPIKTRLASAIGAGPAEQWHCRSAACVATSVRATGMSGYWAVAEPEGLEHPLWRDLPCLAQGPGGLGERMHAVYHQLLRRHRAAILLGADLPQLESRQLQYAAHWLASAEQRYVLGPAHDGGFWLFGGNSPIPRRRWSRVAYSQSDTARAFIHSLDVCGWEMLEMLTDLDQAEDLSRVLLELERIETPHALQRNLIDWIRQRLERAA